MVEDRIPTSPWRRAVAWLVGRLARLRYGYEIPFVDATVRGFGWRAACRRLRALARTCVQLEQRFGERDAHLLLAFSAMLHGCLACARGHLRAANLAHFHLTGELSSLDETLLPELVGAKGGSATGRFAALCRSEQLGAIDELLTRVASLHERSRAEHSEEDELLCRAIDAYDGADHSRARAAATHGIPRLSPRAHDLDLCGRYELARRREQLASAPIGA